MKKICIWYFAMLAGLWVMDANAAEMQLGAGDVIELAVYDHPDLSLETRISEAGTIAYPLIGEVNVSGLSPTEASKKIASLLERGGFIRNAQVSLLVTVMQSQQVSILGQVTRPGRYPVEGTRSITDLVAMAGGLNAEAGDVVTLVRTRNGETTQTRIDLADIMRTDHPTNNLEVLAGDLIYVDRAPKFYIYGEVQHPGVYRLEKNMTVLQALSVGGGLTPRGTQRGVRVKRRDGNGKLVETKVEHDDILKIDDVVYVRESLF